METTALVGYRERDLFVFFSVVTHLENNQ